MIRDWKTGEPIHVQDEDVHHQWQEWQDLILKTNLALRWKIGTPQLSKLPSLSAIGVDRILQTRTFIKEAMIPEQFLISLPILQYVDKSLRISYQALQCLVPQVVPVKKRVSMISDMSPNLDYRESLQPYLTNV